MNTEHPFWSAEKNPFPAQRGEFLINSPVEGITMVLENAPDTSDITFYNNTSTYFQNVFTHRFNDMAAYYSKFCYNSRAGFAVSSMDNYSLDNTISLYTPDRSMYSVRKRFKDYGFLGGALISKHIPFYNDPGTVIQS